VVEIQRQQNPAMNRTVKGKKPRSNKKTPRSRVHDTAVGGTATASDWISGARVRTLPLAIAPVAIGCGAAAVYYVFNPVLSVLALVVALALQIGVNYSNDYSDGVRGTDDYRVGPPRLTGSGAAQPRTVLIVALAFFVLAAAAGLAIVLITGLYWFLAIGAAAIASAWFYTGGRRPYGYFALGEVFVFVFFGLVATVGTTWIQAGKAGAESWLGAGAGFIACAVLMVNNMRDSETDRAAGKKTLAAIMGTWPARVLFCSLLLAPFGIVGFFTLFYPLAFYIFFALLIAIPACVITLFGRTPAEFILVLKLTSLTSLVYGLGLGAVFAF
jgi:1,4-dihydroxy-2-naphthoate octaprenyltransferase